MGVFHGSQRSTLTGARHLRPEELLSEVGLWVWVCVCDSPGERRVLTLLAQRDTDTHSCWRAYRRAHTHAHAHTTFKHRQISLSQTHPETPTHTQI